ncbi:processive 1,2-diacylglycerol beta-glucosyltransferase [Paenibacillus tianmuensis]|uniref:Processive 1,2-diacylglycerol beta-glucosyltransferase n=1 Tax=Paenibacillus tianmuensis TaxID=624147 RepID=A0A1G4TN51_9BACL|nr:glycosyltransferase [Paenibacillus tianmuensis]SCW82627.1 processive 1,2-diacylglycerol beta-glucosyltransferase [Paenibacillus tianmuensis]
MSEANPTILILYASYGDGHLQAAKALQQRFARLGIDRVKLVDLLAEAHPCINAVTRYIYLKSSTLGPDLYGWSFYFTQNLKHDTAFAKSLNRFGLRKFKQMLQAERPDAIIYTFPLPVVSGMMSPNGTPVRTYTLLTDFVLHQRWIHPDIDKYYVATEQLKQQVAASGVPKHRIAVSGIPLRSPFSDPIRPQDVFRKYGMEPSKPVVLLMAGAYGVLKHISRMGPALLQLDEIELVIVCGRNKPLKGQIESSFAGHPRVRILGYVEDIHELMAVSSCLITKAGGITLSEALAMRLPVIVYRPLPGQEKENARFLSEQGAVEIAQSSDELISLVKRIVSLPGQAERMKAAMENLYSGDAAEAVVSDVLEGLSRTNTELFG